MRVGRYFRKRCVPDRIAGIQPLQAHLTRQRGARFTHPGHPEAPRPGAMAEHHWVSQLELAQDLPKIGPAPADVAALRLFQHWATGGVHAHQPHLQAHLGPRFSASSHPCPDVKGRCCAFQVTNVRGPGSRRPYLGTRPAGFRPGAGPASDSRICFRVSSALGRSGRVALT